MTTSTTRFEPLGELYVGTLVENANYGGIPGTIRDAVWASLQGDTKTNINCGLIDAAAKVTHDAMGFVEQSKGWVSGDWIASNPHQLQRLCDWKRIDAFFDMASLHQTDERFWVIHQLEEQVTRCSYSDMRMEAQLFNAAALLLKEVQS